MLAHLSAPRGACRVVSFIGISAHTLRTPQRAHGVRADRGVGGITAGGVKVPRLWLLRQSSGIRRIPTQKRRRTFRTIRLAAFSVCQGPPSTRQRILVERFAVSREGAGCSGQGQRGADSGSQVLRPSFERPFVPHGFVRKPPRHPDRAFFIHLLLRGECVRSHPRVGHVSAQSQIGEAGRDIVRASLRLALPKPVSNRR